MKQWTGQRGRYKDTNPVGHNRKTNNECLLLKPTISISIINSHCVRRAVTSN